MLDSRTSMSRVAAAALALAAACTGTVAGNGGGAPAPMGQPGGTVAPAPPGQNPVAPPTVSAGVAPMRRLTREQYRNSVRDLVGVEDAVASSALPGDDAIVDRFHSNVLSPLQTID